MEKGEKDDTKACPKCAEDIKKVAKACKRCGKKFGMTAGKWFLLIFFILFVGFPMYSYFTALSEVGGVTKKGSPTYNQQVAPRQALNVSDLPEHEVIRREDHDYPAISISSILLKDETVFTVDDEKFEKIAKQFFQRDKRYYHFFTMNIAYVAQKRMDLLDNRFGYSEANEIGNDLSACGFLGSINQYGVIDQHPSDIASLYDPSQSKCAEVWEKWGNCVYTGSSFTCG